MSALHHAWGLALKPLASEDSQSIGNYSNTKLVFAIVVILN